MFEGDDRYARNDLKEWLDAHGGKDTSGRGALSPRSNATSPRSPGNKKKKGGEGKEEDGGAHAIETGTA